MQIETEAFYLGSQKIHSNKSGKDFVKFSFVVDGEFCSFFTLAKNGEEFLKSKACQDFGKTHSPTKCVARLNLKFTEKGTYTDLIGIA